MILYNNSETDLSGYYYYFYKELFYMKVEERLFAALISPFDVRDYQFKATLSEDLPETFELPSVTAEEIHTRKQASSPQTRSSAKACPSQYPA